MTTQKNEGEGNHSAARAYNKAHYDSAKVARSDASPTDAAVSACLVLGARVYAETR
jgi:hypothetical protein